MPFLLATASCQYGVLLLVHGRCCRATVRLPRDTRSGEHIQNEQPLRGLSKLSVLACVHRILSCLLIRLSNLVSTPT